MTKTQLPHAQLPQTQLPIIQGLWIGDELSRVEHHSILSWIHLGYTYHLYTYHPVKNIPSNTIIKDAREIIPESDIFYYNGSITPFSDLFRYKLLYDRGGVWTDCDIFAIQQFPTNIDMAFVTERTILKGAFSNCTRKPPIVCKDHKVLNSFIYTKYHKNPIMYKMYEIANTARLAILSRASPPLHRKNASVKHRQTHAQKHTLKNIGLKSYHWRGGSETLEREIRKHNMTQYIMRPEFAFPINWWDFKYAFKGDIEIIPPSRGWNTPININNILQGNHGHTFMITIHNGWIKKQKLDKNKIYPSNSLYERIILTHTT